MRESLLLHTGILLGHLTLPTLYHVIYSCIGQRDSVSVPTLPTTSTEIAGKIRTTAAKVTPAMLTDLSTKLQYRYVQGH